MTTADDLPALNVDTWPIATIIDGHIIGWRESQVRDIATAYALAARAERDKQWRDWGVIEVAIRSPAVAEYMKHWEGRTETAEKRVAELEERLMVMCVAQLEVGLAPWELLQNSAKLLRLVRRCDLTRPNELTAVIDAQCKDIDAVLKRLVPAPDPPSPAPLAVQGVEGEPHHER